MQEYMRVCPICEKENDRSIFKSKLYVPGWFDFWDSEPSADTVCDFHSNQKLIKTLITCEEFQVLREISNEPSFMQAMNNLKVKDIIEYNLKLSQFKTQTKQIQQVKESSKPHCPTCGSTNIKAISGTERAASIIGLGIFSKKINKSWKCLDCKGTW